jgi:hypothetical protein
VDVSSQNCTKSRGYVADADDVMGVAEGVTTRTDGGAVDRLVNTKDVTVNLYLLPAGLLNNV